MKRTLLDTLKKVASLSEIIDEAQTHEELAETSIKFLTKELGYHNTIFILRTGKNLKILSYNNIPRHKILLKRIISEFNNNAVIDFRTKSPKNLLEKSCVQNKIFTSNKIADILHPIISKETSIQLQRALNAESFITIPCVSHSYTEAVIITTSASSILKQEEEVLLRILAKNVGNTIKNIRLVQETARDKENFIKILGNSLEGVIVYKGNTIYYVSLRLSEITEYSIEELMQSKDAMFLLPPHERKRVEEIARIRETKQELTSKYETVMQTKTGALVPVEITTTKALFKGEEMLMVNVRNISKYKESIEKLGKLYKEQGKVFAKIAHSLQTPFTVIKGMVELNMDKFDDMPDSYKEMMLVIKDEVTQASTKLADLLNVAKTEVRDINIVQVPMHNKPFIEAAYTKGKALGYKYCKQVHSNNCPCFQLQKNEKGMVSIDPHAIMDVLMTLIDNAYKYAGNKDGTHSITLNSQVENEDLVITVSDKGKGISKVQQKELFQPFSITRKYKTEHGIGLPLCKKIIDLHKGKIEVESIQNRGTVFTIKLPLID